MTSTDLPTGSILLDRYEVGALLGSGGFGVVHKARQLATSQLVAVKVMRPLTDDAAPVREKRIARFRLEMEMCARVHHPNIVGLIDFGQLDDGRLFTVFEFVPGQTLEQVLAAEGPLHPREARHLMLQVLDALSSAHSQGVVHRDLKPANLMIVSTGTRRNAQVLDFGVGALDDTLHHSASPRLTSTNEWLGTPHYTAPEQVRGYPPTTQSDLYAWGLVYLECLTGRPVITGSSMAALLMSQLGPEPVPIPATLRHHALGRILQRAVAKDMAEREATAATLMRQLEDCDISDLDRFMALDPLGATMAHELPRTASVALAPHGVDEGATRTMKPAELREGAAAPASRGGHDSARAPSRLVDAERRQVTVLCCTLAATAAAEATPAELDALEEQLAAMQDLSAELAEQHQGKVVGGVGKHVLLQFGYPAAREDDAQRAASTALALREAARTRPGLTLRLGLHTGLVAYGASLHSRRLPGQLIGATSTVAAELSAAAEDQSIWVSAAGAMLLRGQFELAPKVSPLLDRGARPLEVFELIGERDAARVQKSSVNLLLASPLVGRDREIELMVERWRQVEAGVGQSVLVTGEPGIGKSRLVFELSRRASERPHLWLDARCTQETRNRALSPVIELVERLFELGDRPPAERLERLEASLLGYGFRPADAVPLFGSLLGLPLADRYPQRDLSRQRLRELIFDAVLSLLIELAERQPVVVLIEDLHWADLTTLEFLGELVATAPTGRLLVLLTARAEFSPSWPSSELLQIQLSRLAQPQIEQIVQAIAAHKPLSAKVQAQLVQRTDGVPLFIEELTRMVVEDSLSEDAIPSTLRDSLMARLDRMGRAKETAQLASAIGREFDLPLLTAVTSLTEDEVQQDLDKLVASDLVHHRRRLRNPTWLFRHALIRDTAYDSMPRRVQQRVHARIADALESQFAELAESRPELLAFHHAAAEQKAVAIGYGQKAALAALTNAEYPYAIRHARDAIGWLDAITDKRTRAELELGFNSIITPALMSTRGWRDPELEATIARSAALNDRLGDSRFTGPTLWALMLFHHMGGRQGEIAAAMGERMLAHARDTGDASQAVMAEAALGHCRWIAGRYREAQEHFERLLATYDPVAHRGHAYVYGHDSKVWAGISYAEALWFMGWPERSLELAETILSWARELRHANTLAVAYIFFILLRHDRDERDAIEPLWSALLELSSRHGLPVHVAYAGVVRCWAIGDVDGAKQHLGLLETTGTELGLSFYRAVVAEAEAEHGQLDAALARIEECRARAQEVGEAYYLAEVLRLKGSFLRRRAGSGAEAETCLRRAIAVAQEQGTKMSELRAALELAAALRERGALDEARLLLEPFVGAFQEGHRSAPLRQLGELLADLRRSGDVAVHT
jgi:TOMM system kinase/cyclase fusion protein